MNFYLAAGYDQKTDAQIAAKAIENATGYRCNAQWLWQEQNLAALDKTNLNKVLVQNALLDWYDVQQADVFVLLSGASTTGGKWVEFGMAIGYGKKVYYLDKWLTLLPELTHEPINIVPPIFSLLPIVEWADNLEHLVDIWSKD